MGVGPGEAGVAAGRVGGAGLGALIPGYPQWRWRQRERALALSGTFASALAVGLFAWGTPLGLASLGLAFASHVASAVDAIRQAAFPGFARGVPALSASFGLGLGCYAPALALAAVVAWPGPRHGAPGESYLVDRLAYREVSPAPGEWVHHRRPDGSGFDLARVVAGPGERVEWSDGRLRVGDRELGWLPEARAGSPLELAIEVPPGHLLVAPARGSRRTGASSGLMLLPERCVNGRAWAQLYPLWSRRFLF